MSRASIDRSRADAALRIAALMAVTEHWDSDTLDAIAEILDQHQLGERCPVCGLFKVPGAPCAHEDRHDLDDEENGR